MPGLPKKQLGRLFGTACRLLRNGLLKIQYGKHLSFTEGQIWRARIERGFKLEVRGEGFRVKFGRNINVRRSVWLRGSGEMHFGNYVKLGRNCIIASNQSVSIGDNVLIADNVSIRDADHNYNDPNQLIREQGISSAPVRIGSDVWIGYGVVITPGVEIGDGCVIGANAVVTRSVPPYSICVGVPARVIKSRKA